VHWYAKVLKLCDQSVILICCAVSAEVILNHPCVLVQQQPQSLFSTNIWCTGSATGAESLPPFYAIPWPRSWNLRPGISPRCLTFLWQASGDSTLRLPSQPAWNDARGQVFWRRYWFYSDILFKIGNMINVCFAVKYTSKIRAVYKNRWSISYINLLFGKMLGNMRNHFVPIRRLLESRPLVKC
jgi:hypothetical protein